MSTQKQALKDVALDTEAQSMLNPWGTALLVWLLSSLFYFYQFFVQVSPGIMKPELSIEFALNGEQFGSLSAYYLYVYALMQIPAGLLLDRFGPKKLLVFACLCCAVGALGFGYATSFTHAKIARILMGLGGSFAVIGSFKLSTMWFPSDRFALMSGLTVAVGFLGGATAQAPLALLMHCYDWRATMMVVAFAGLILGGILALFLRESPPYDYSGTEQNIRSPRQIFKELMKIIRTPQILLASIFASIMFIPTLAFGELWGIPFLVEAHHFSREAAGSLISLIFLGWALGSPLYGYLSDRYHNRNIPMYFANLSTFFIFLGLMSLHSMPLFAVGILLFLLGLCSSGFVLAFVVVRELCLPHLAGTAIGFINILNTLGGALAQPLIGRVLDASWSGLVSSSGEKIFTLEEYHSALFIVPALLVISFMTVLFLKETHARPLHRHDRGAA